MECNPEPGWGADTEGAFLIRPSTCGQLWQARGSGDRALVPGHSLASSQAPDGLAHLLTLPSSHPRCMPARLDLPEAENFCSPWGDPFLLEHPSWSTPLPCPREQTSPPAVRRELTTGYFHNRMAFRTWSERFKNCHGPILQKEK